MLYVTRMLKQWPHTTAQKNEPVPHNLQSPKRGNKGAAFIRKGERSAPQHFASQPHPQAPILPSIPLVSLNFPSPSFSCLYFLSFWKETGRNKHQLRLVRPPSVLKAHAPQFAHSSHRAPVNKISVSTDTFTPAHPASIVR